MRKVELTNRVFRPYRKRHDDDDGVSLFDRIERNRGRLTNSDDDAFTYDDEDDGLSFYG
jgi:hypothetical protein